MVLRQESPASREAHGLFGPVTRLYEGVRAEEGEPNKNRGYFEYQVEAGCANNELGRVGSCNSN